MLAKLPTYQDIEQALTERTFTVAQISRLYDLIERSKKTTLEAEKQYWAIAEPINLMPSDWGMYGKSTSGWYKAKQALDEVGVKLVIAIRNGSQPECYNAFENVVKVQMQFKRFGAYDTEGRSSLYSLIVKSCSGSVFNPDELWEYFNEELTFHI